ncbi:hypothetical protein ACVJGD_005473 [Bradyrhizobium sp. USDA 10063]
MSDSVGGPAAAPNIMMPFVSAVSFKLSIFILPFLSPGAARDDHGQAPFVRPCEGKDGLSRRTSPAQSSQQSGREFSSADAATRADHEALQIVPSSSTVSISSRSGREPFPHPLSRSRYCRLPSCFARASHCDLARDLHDKRYRRISNLRESPPSARRSIKLTPSDPLIRCIISEKTQPVRLSNFLREIDHQRT